MMPLLDPAGRETRPVVTVTSVLYRSEDVIGESIRAIKPALDDGFAKLIAVDNASPDQSAAVVAAEVANARIVRSAVNRGFAGGANLAWPDVEGRYWLLLNPDAVLTAEGLRGLVAWMDDHPEVGIAAPAAADLDGSNVHHSGHALPSVGLVLLELFRLHRMLPRGLRARLLQGPYWDGGSHLDAGWVPGTAMIVRRQAVENVGLLDESFFLYGEDIDWCWRMHRGGWYVGSCSEVVVRHAGCQSSFAAFGRHETLIRGARAEIEAARRVRGRVRGWLYGVATTVAVGLESIHPRRSREERAQARAFFRSWRHAVLSPRRDGEGGEDPAGIDGGSDSRTRVIEPAQ
jgi:GT2 family glycosyltransferase